MTEPNPEGSPIEAAASDVGPHAAEAFALLGNETRLAILLALWEAHEPHSEASAVSFSKLREMVGIRQGAQFNYHLGKLVGRFVRKTDAGYALTRPGRLLVQSIIAGTGIEEPTLDRTEIGVACERCGAPTAVTYANSYVYQVCTECDGDFEENDVHPRGALKAWTFEPTGLSGRTAEEVFAASTVKTFGRIAMRFERICPVCSAPVEWSVDACETHDPGPDGECPDCGRARAVLVRETCTVCKSSGMGTPGIKVMFHPAVVSFLYDRGVAVGFPGDTGFDDVVRILDVVEGFEEEVIATDPLRVRVTVARDGDELHLVLDEGMHVVEVDGPHPVEGGD